MQQITRIHNGKRFLVNVATDDGVGAGFAVGQLVVKSYTDKFWYVVTASGSNGAVVPFVSQSRLTSFGTSSYYDQNYPYQLLNAVSQSQSRSYAVFLTGTQPTATLTVSQSAYTGSAQPKPYLLLQNITNGQYYRAFLTYTGNTVSLAVNQTLISSSWVHPIF